MVRPLRRIAIALAVTVSLASACGPEERSRHAAPPPVPTEIEPTGVVPGSEDEPPYPNPTPLPTTAPAPAVPPSTLVIGAHGPWVRRLQEALTAATYDPGTIDGLFGDMTLHAVYAYEKVNGLELSGTVPPSVFRTIARARPPRIEPRDVSTYVEVDIGRQVLFEIDEGVLTHTLPVSTGNEEYYNSTSGLAVAHTPRGDFAIWQKIAGWRIGYLGAMYYPSYFYNGYAIHGSASVPPYPASHGCVRIPMHSTVAFFERNPIGTPVFVRD